ncbi:unnamed protein product [Euphydryas editha]|uniref:Gag protein n=1 Tax=Euphydryas editha TaxID=104508 RepID=A0AAU9UE00_EUPED|nr:unnamed protein product [Euphydryas editha]
MLPIRESIGGVVKGPSQGQPKGPSQGQPHGPSQGQPNGPSQGQPNGPSQGQPNGPSQGQPNGPSQGQPQGEVVEILEDISITSLSETDLGRKRLYSGGSEGSATETGAGVAAAGKTRSAAKRGRAPTLTSARAALRERVERDREDGFEAALQRRAFCKQKEVGLTEEVPIELEDVHRRGTEELMAASEANLNLILGLTGKSVNLKGGYTAKIRRAAGSIREVLESLVARTESDEVRRLRADNSRLSRELDLVREEVRAYRREFEDSRKKAAEPSNKESSADLMHEFPNMVGTLLDGRLAAFQLPAAPPCHPPLAGDSAPLARATRAALAEKGKGSTAPSANEVARGEPGGVARPSPSSEQGKGEGQGEGKGKGGGVDSVWPLDLKGSGPPSSRVTGGAGG